MTALQSKKHRLFFSSIILSLLILLIISAWSLQEAYSLQTGFYPIASYATSIADQDENVKRNIALATSAINGSIIPSGGIFSFNNVVGEGSIKNGYLLGRVLYKDMVVMEPGGGVCQVSSTLFNAFLLAGCTIIERHRHVQPVTYVPFGLDATIKYGKKDLKMKNNLSRSLKISAVITDQTLNITLFSETPSTYNYQVYTDIEENEMPLGDDSAHVRQGITVYVYRKKYATNKLLETLMLYKDYYPPVIRK